MKHEGPLTLEDIEGVAEPLEEVNRLLKRVEEGYIPQFGYERDLLRKVAPIRLDQVKERIVEARRLGLKKGYEELSQCMLRLEATLQIIEHQDSQFDWKRREEHEKEGRREE